ncbi:MAG: hypothetical protein M5U28_06615 [Sandaracinaceae bacterium]|nr:hypothetical protein [Sandaracinaceae bacterium]
MLDEIGDLWHDKLKNSQKAIESYAEASELEPNNHRLLHKLLGLYQQTKQWDEAIGIIQRVSDLDERAAAKSKYAYTVGVILRDEVKDTERALEKFDEALDLDRTQLKAFEAINKILNTTKDWKQLERAFRKMVRRVKTQGDGDSELEFNLWHNLGVIYRDRLKHFESAVTAFSEAAKLKPDADQEHVILAELYTLLGPDKLQDAINEHQWLLRRDPYRVESYQALYRLYFDARAYDKAWCLAATLSFLKKADAEQQKFYADNKNSGPIRPQNRLNDERWLRDLAHPEQDLLLSKIFEQVWPAVLSLRVQSDKDAGLNKKHEVDPASSTVTFARTFGFVANVLGLPTPRLFLRTDVQGGLTHMPVWPLASLSGATLLSGFSPGDLMFVAGRHLADYRPEHYIRTMLKSNTGAEGGAPRRPAAGEPRAGRRGGGRADRAAAPGEDAAWPARRPAQPRQAVRGRGSARGRQAVAPVRGADLVPCGPARGQRSRDGGEDGHPARRPGSGGPPSEGEGQGAGPLQRERGVLPPPRAPRHPHPVGLTGGHTPNG